jgi:hypothetical protein
MKDGLGTRCAFGGVKLIGIKLVLFLLVFVVSSSLFVDKIWSLGSWTWIFRVFFNVRK